MIKGRYLTDDAFAERNHTRRMGISSLVLAFRPSTSGDDARLSLLPDSGKDEHWHRRRAILGEHPEIRRLFGHNAATATIACVVVVAQFASSAAAARQSWWIALLLSFAVGAFCMHYLHVVIHECSHNLVFGNSSLDKACAILANLPGVLPSAMGFRYYHLSPMSLRCGRSQRSVPAGWGNSSG